MENSWKICSNLWKVEKSGKKCEKWENLVKVSKVKKVFQKYFLPRKTKKC